MCFKRKKKEKVVINSRFAIGDTVRFRNERGELINGHVYEIKLNKDGLVIYDIQVGGECPYIKYGIPEDKIISNIKH